MLSLFYKNLEMKITKNIGITIFKPNTNNQLILIKSELGQFKLKWNCLKNKLNESMNILPNINNISWENKDVENSKDFLEEKENVENILKINNYNIWINNYINEINFWTFKNENKHLVYDIKTKKIIDIICTQTSINKKNILKNINNIKNNKLIEKNNTIEKESQNISENNIIYNGYMLTLQNYLKKQTNINNNKRQEKINELLNILELESQKKIEEKILNKQLKNIIIGLTQGFTINLELKGIGYQAKINENTETKNNRFNKKITNNDNTQLESNFKELKKYIKNNIQNLKNNEKGENDIRIMLTKNIESSIKKKQIQIKKNKIQTDIQTQTQTQNKNKSLILKLGKSHNIEYPLNKDEIDIKITVSPQNITNISIYSISYNIANKVAAKIYLLRKPEPYKGKGIRYNGEKFFAKQTKKKKLN